MSDRRERIGWGGMWDMWGGAVASVPAHSAVVFAVEVSNVTVEPPHEPHQRRPDPTEHEPFSTIHSTDTT